MKRSHTRVFLDEVLVEVSIGYTEWEKFPGKRWPLSVSVELYTQKAYWPEPHLSRLIDYSPVYDYIQSWSGRPHVEYLETLAEDLIEFCFRDEKVDACRVRLRKPQIFVHAAGAGIEIFRWRASAGDQKPL
jgi:dihydroneopterin aldolase